MAEQKHESGLSVAAKLAFAAVNASNAKGLSSMTAGLVHTGMTARTVRGKAAAFAGAGVALTGTVVSAAIAGGTVASLLTSSAKAAEGARDGVRKDNSGTPGDLLDVVAAVAQTAVASAGVAGVLIGRDIIKDSNLAARINARAGAHIMNSGRLAETGPLSLVRGRIGGALVMASGAAAAIAAGAPLIVGKAKAAEVPAAAPSPAPASPPAQSSGLMTAAEVGLGTAATVSAVKTVKALAGNPAARAAVGLASKVFLPLTVGLAVYDGVKGFQENGVKGAATGVADSLTGGGFSLAVNALLGSQTPAAAPATPEVVVSDRLAVARDAAGRTAGEMGQTTTLNQGSARVADVETSDGQTDSYYRMSFGRRVQVSGYKTPG